jgi:superfamily II DNA or RNA helicase
MKLDIQWGTPYQIFDGPSKKWRREWCIPTEYLNSFFEFWKKNKYSMLGDGFTVVKSKVKNKWFLFDTKIAKEQFKEFGKSSTDVKPRQIESFELPPYTVKKKTGLRPWQVGAAEKIVSSITHWGAAIDGSEMGIGKTYTSGGVARELNVPFVIVCPKPVISQWKKVIETHFKLNKNFKGIINYELLIRGRKDSSIASFVLNRETRRKTFTWKLPKNSLIIWDEAHRLKNYKTKTSKTSLAAFKQNYKQLFLSATLATSPLDLRTIGECTKLFKGNKSYYEWAYNHGVYKGAWGLEFNNDPDILKEIHTLLFSHRGVRLQRDIIPNFPETEIIVSAYDMDEADAKEIREVYSNMKKELKVLDIKGKTDDSEMAIRTRALQRSEILKIPLMEEMIKEGIDAGMSVVVFLNYSDSIDALAKRFNTDCIYDGRNEKIRHKFIEAFQNNTQQLLITNSAAAKEGLNIGDEHGGHPRLALISPTYSVRILKQILGRIHRENSKTKSVQKIIYAANTQEDNVVDNVGEKLENMTLINNGIITDNDLKI